MLLQLFHPIPDDIDFSWPSPAFDPEILVQYSPFVILMMLSVSVVCDQSTAF